MRYGIALWTFLIAVPTAGKAYSAVPLAYRKRPFLIGKKNMDQGPMSFWRRNFTGRDHISIIAAMC